LAVLSSAHALAKQVENEVTFRVIQVSKYGFRPVKGLICLYLSANTVPFKNI